MSAFWDVSQLHSPLASAADFDGEGFLRQPQQWTPELAQAIAACLSWSQGRGLSEEHLQVIDCCRRFYQQYQRMPTTRVFVKYLGQTLGPDWASSLRLMHLFPDTPMRWLAICAGLPKPPNCF